MQIKERDIMDNLKTMLMEFLVLVDDLQNIFKRIVLIKYRMRSSLNVEE